MDELIEFQRKKLLEMGRQFVPHLTLDDLLQPNDFPELEFNPHFRYEEGVLAGLLMAKCKLLARREGEECKNVRKVLTQRHRGTEGSACAQSAHE